MKVYAGIRPEYKVEEAMKQVHEYEYGEFVVNKANVDHLLLVMPRWSLRIAELSNKATPVFNVSTGCRSFILDRALCYPTPYTKLSKAEVFGYLFK